MILATVSINLIINNGILDKAKSAIDKYSEGEIEEQIKLAYLEWQTAKLTGTTENANDYIKNKLNDKIKNIEDINKIGNSIMIIFSSGKIYTYNIVDGKMNDITNTTNISKTTDNNFVGYYADIDADGTVDGIIFADLLVGNTNGNKWGNSEETYSIPTINSNNLKDYYITKTEHNDIFGKNPVIAPKGAGNNRFYIMQLSDYTINSSSTFYWYYNADRKMTDYNETTLENFGTGKTNTNKMIIKWNNKEYGNQNSQDIWGNISNVVEEGWFIPSKDEWLAFGNELNVTSDKRLQYGFNQYCYHSSSQRTARFVWDAHLYQGNINQIYVNNLIGIRLATTF